MKQLEQANKRAGNPKPQGGENAPSPESGDHHSTMSATTTELTASDLGTPEPVPEEITKPDVLDWIKKARESIEAFGGYINMGGPGVTKDLLGEDVLGWKDSSSSDDAEEYPEGEPEEEGDIHVEVEDVDAKPDGERPASRGRTRLVEQLGESSSAQGRDASKDSRRKKSRQRDKLAILPNEAAPLGMLANLSLRASRSRKSSRSPSVSTADDNDFGVANDDYFRASSKCSTGIVEFSRAHVYHPGPGPDRPLIYPHHQAPYILRSGLVSPVEVEKLFKMCVCRSYHIILIVNVFGRYHDYMNPSVSLLDPVLYTAQRTYWRSPFLFTVGESLQCI